jgi:RNA polymerase sigma factor (sigma-70 family)
MNTTPNPMPDPAWTPDELKKLLNNCYPKLYSRALAITKNAESSKDIVMKNFHKLLEGRSDIKPNKNACDRLITWVSNDSKTYLTRKARSENRNEVFQENCQAESDLDLEQQISSADDCRRLYKQIEKLPTECCKVLKLDFKGLSIREIAFQLNKNERTVRAHKARGIKLLAKKYGMTNRSRS